MNALGLTCRIIFAQAMIVACSTTMGNMAKIAEHADIPMPPFEKLDRQKLLYIEERLQKYMDKKYDGRYANLPAELRQDAIVVACAGPKVKDLMSFTAYRWVDHVVEFEPDELQEEAEILLIPRWWD
jgi:glucokinase